MSVSHSVLTKKGYGQFRAKITLYRLLKASIMFNINYLFYFILLSLSHPVAATSWASVNTPSKQAARSIGTYTSGCISGAVALPSEGTGYQVMRPSRQRHYGHPHLIDFIQQLGQYSAHEQVSNLLIGDLGQARGGPTPSGHRSHQTGLDVDIWFLLFQPSTPRNLSEQERETWDAPSMLSRTDAIDATQWTTRHEKILAAAAQLPHVERIFVNPSIKRELCHRFPANNRAWLRKIRPWWKHDDHFHVRLRCPEDNKQCQAQQALPAGDGCGADLAWWFSATAKQSTKKTAPTHRKTVALPALCKQVLTE